MADSDLAPCFDSDFEQIVVIKDEDAACLAFIAIHDTRLGPAFGGVRCKGYDRPADALRDACALARTMTYKCALAEIPGGGGKCVIIDRPALQRAAAYARVAQHVENLGGRFYTGPDFGTRSDDLAAMAARTRYVAHPDGTAASDVAAATALGVAAAIAAVAARLGRSDLEGMTVAIQGVGAVGERLAARLDAAGCRLFVADVRAAAAERVAEQHGAEVVPAAAILDLPVDVLAPCALGGFLDVELAGRLPARAVCGAANNVLADPAAGAELHRRGVIYAPDLVVNAGALIQGAITRLEGKPPPHSRILAIGPRLQAILDRSARDNRPPAAIALQMATERLQAAAPTPFFPAPGGRAR